MITLSSFGFAQNDFEIIPEATNPSEVAEAVEAV
jgi:hypothetical protein